MVKIFIMVTILFWRPIMSKPVILLMEDNQYLANIFRLKLELMNYYVHVVNTGVEAMSLMTNISPDLVVLDLHVPVVSGWHVLEFINTNPQLTHTKILLISADVILLNTIEFRAYVKLEKPVGIRVFAGAVRKLLE